MLTWHSSSSRRCPITNDRKNFEKFLYMCRFSLDLDDFFFAGYEFFYFQTTSIQGLEMFWYISHVGFCRGKFSSVQVVLRLQDFSHFFS